jgi:hypothetical protein
MRALGASRTSLVPGGVLAGPWVRDPLWRNARAVPSLDLRFADNKSLVDAVTGASLVTFTRASSKTVTNSAGVLETVGIDVPAFDHNPTTGESLGLLVEEQRTNLLLNSATLSTQSVTVAAAANTLSFYGTGTVTLTGVSTAGPLVGTGANNRVSLTFTPIVGVLVLTVSGSVTNAQLEAGAFPTSYIPTTTAAVTRSADVASITGSAYSSWFTNANENTFYVEAIKTSANVSNGTFFCGSDSSVNALAGGWITYNSAGERMRIQSRHDSVRGDTIGNAAVITSGTLIKGALCTSTTTFGAAYNGSLIASAATPTQLDWSTSLAIGWFPNGGYTGALNGTIRRICYWNQRLPSSTLQAITG